MRDENQCMPPWLELVALDDASIKYFDRAELVPGDKEGRRGYNFRHQARRPAGPHRRSPGHKWKQDPHHLEISKLHPPGRDSVGEYLLSVRPDQQPPSRPEHGYENVPHRQEHRSTIVSKGNQCRPWSKTRIAVS